MENISLRLDRQEARINQRDAILHQRGAFLRQRGAFLHQLDETLNQLGTRINQQGAMINELGARINEQGARISEQGSKINELGARINEQGSKINELGARINEQGVRINEQGARINELGASFNALGAVINEQGLRINENGLRINVLEFDMRYQQLLLILQELNSFFKIEDACRKNNQLLIAVKIRYLNMAGIRGYHLLSVAPHSDPYTVADYQPLDADCDNQAEICHKFIVLRRFLSSSAITDAHIDKVGRDMFVAIKRHFEAAIAGPDTLDPAKSLTEEDVNTLNKYLANSLHLFTDFTV